jgi:hypothetical protein
MHFYPDGPIKGWISSGVGFMVPQAEYLDERESAEWTDDDSGPGWYARLTAPGYLDCTEWQGPYPSVFRAVRDLLRHFEIDLDGEPLPEALGIGS